MEYLGPGVYTIDYLAKYEATFGGVFQNRYPLISSDSGEDGAFELEGKFYRLADPEKGAQFYLSKSIHLFYGNGGLFGVERPVVDMDSQDQQGLHSSTNNWKSVNAIRKFPDRDGVLVWGGRTDHSIG